MATHDEKYDVAAVQIVGNGALLYFVIAEHGAEVNVGRHNNAADGEDHRVRKKLGFLPKHLEGFAVCDVRLPSNMKSNGRWKDKLSLFQPCRDRLTTCK